MQGKALWWAGVGSRLGQALDAGVPGWAVVGSRHCSILSRGGGEGVSEIALVVGGGCRMSRAILLPISI